MKLKVYQCYFDESQKNVLESCFVPFDNTKNQNPELREYPLLKRIWETEKSPYWGMVSWKWKEKTKLPGQEYLDWIQQNPGYDVYHMNPFMYIPFDQMNPMVEGNKHHPGMKEYFDILVSELTPEFGHEFKYYHPDSETYHDNTVSHHCFPTEKFMYTSSYVGNKKFWNRWIAFADRCIEISRNNPKLNEFMFIRNSNYGNKPLPNFSFIMERLVGLFLYTVGNDLKVRNFPYHHRCFQELYPQQHSEYMMRINDRLLDFDFNPKLYKSYEKIGHIPRMLR